MLRAYLQLIRWDKPIGTLLLLWPTWWGLWLAFHAMPGFKVCLAFSLGVFLTRSAGCAINDFADSDFDGKVARTAQRPLARGVISKKSALLVCAVFSLAAFVLAWVCLKPRTLLWAVPALLLFVSYPFCKRFFPLPQLYLGFAFSFGIPMAYIESLGFVPLSGWLLFATNCAWVVAYDTIYALVDIEDDLKLGLKTSAITFGQQVIPMILACYALFLAGMLGVALCSGLSWYFYLGWLLEVFLVYRVYRQIRELDPQRCFKAFLYNNNLGALMFLALVLGLGVS